MNAIDPAAARPGNVRVVHLNGATFSALAAGDLAAANAASPVPVSPYLAGPECQSVWTRRRNQCDEDPATAAWVTGIIWDDQTQQAVGRAGFHTSPDPDGLVEIGYAVDPAYRRRGYARAALEALLTRAANEPSVTRVRASVRPDNLPSYNLIAQYGFTKTGEQWDEEDGLEYIYERPANP